MADDGEEYCDIINGREPATVELIQSWARAAHGPPLSDEQATALARDVNYALLFSQEWRDENRAGRENNPSLIRLRRVADALRTLKANLPGVIAESRRGSRSGDVSATESLLDLVDRHSKIIEYCPPRGRGRAISLEKNLSTNLARKVGLAWEGVATTASADAFASIALSWLTGRPVKSDEPVRKARERRRTKKR